MTDYTKTTDFTSKDSLPSGDSGKIIRGAEFGTEFDNIQTAVNSKSNINNPAFTGNITVTGTVDGRDIAADGTKLDTIETSADVTDTANVTAAGAVMDSELTDITAVKALNQGVATTDSPTFAAVTSTGNVTVGGTVDGRDVATDGTKLDTVETNADVTDTTNVTAAGALMDSEVTNLAQVKAFDSADYATAAQGTTADNALPKTGGAMTGAITTNSTFDGRDVATDGTKLDGIEASADVTDTANVTAAGALMDSELTSIASVKALNQGVATTDSPTFAGVTANGTVEFDGLSGTGAVTVTDILDQDNMSSNSATALATQQSIKAYVDSQVGTVDTLAEVLANGNATGGTDIAFGDNDKALFGADSDLQIYHDGDTSYISHNTTGTDLVIEATSPGDDVIVRAADDLNFRVNGNENGIVVVAGGATTLYNSNAVKLATSSTGIDVTGDVSIPDGSASANRLLLGTGDDSKMFHNGTDAYWINDTGNIIIRNQSDDKDILIQTDDGSGGTTTYITVDGSETDVSLHYGGVEKLATTATGVDVTGTVTADGLTISSATANVADLRRANNTGAGQVLLGNSDGHVRLSGTNGSFDVFNSGNTAQRFGVANNGDVQLFEDTGTTAKFHWDASAESLRVPLSLYDNSVNAFPSEGYASVYSTGAGGSAPFNEAGHLVLQARSSGALRDILFATGNGAVERMRISSDGSVGIGTQSPAAMLNTKGNDALLLESTGSDNYGFHVTVDHGTDMVKLGALDSADGSKDGSTITFGDFGRNIEFSTNKGASLFEAMRLDSSGNLLVGKTSSNASTVGIEARPDGVFTATRAGNTVGLFSRTTSDGTIVEFRRDSTSVGSIGSFASDITIGKSACGLRFEDGTETIRPHNVNTNVSNDANVTLGNSDSRFKDGHFSGNINAATFTATDGIYLGGNGFANKLDDYEEGTVTTPSNTGITLGDGSISGRYTKVGNRVMVDYLVSFGSTTAVTGGVSFNLPFALAGNPVAASAYFIESGVQYWAASARANGSTISVEALNSSGTYTGHTALSSTVPFSWGTSDAMYVTVVYQTA